MKYVPVCVVIAIQVITIRVYSHRRRLGGNPLISNKIMLNDARKDIVFKIMNCPYSSGCLSAIADLPAWCWYEWSSQTPPGGVIPSSKDTVAVSDATTINALRFLPNQSMCLCFTTGSLELSSPSWIAVWLEKPQLYCYQILLMVSFSFLRLRHIEGTLWCLCLLNLLDFDIEHPVLWFHLHFGHWPAQNFMTCTKFASSNLLRN